MSTATTLAGVSRQWREGPKIVRIDVRTKDHPKPTEAQVRREAALLNNLGNGGMVVISAEAIKALAQETAPEENAKAADFCAARASRIAARETEVAAQ